MDNTLNVLNQQMTDQNSENQFVSFNLDAEEYGVDVLLVQEIIRYQRPTKIPNANSVVQGVINFRGQVIPLLDMREAFGLVPSEYDIYTVIIILEVKGKTLGLVVDRVSDIVSFGTGDIQIADEGFINDVQAEYIRAMGKLADRLILLLNTDKLLCFGEWGVKSGPPVSS